jgi:hypothetical protein
MIENTLGFSPFHGGFCTNCQSGATAKKLKEKRRYTKGTGSAVP